MVDVNVDVEYCSGCGYLPRYQELEGHIKEAVPSAKVNGIEGRTGSFEVTVNGQLVYSKLRTMAFPDFKNVSDIVQDAAGGRPITQVDKQQPINCVII